MLGKFFKLSRIYKVINITNVTNILLAGIGDYSVSSLN